ncbi:MAG: hypothetical protein ABR875_03390 [Minisyncoccia bacterium]|jgi:hypothetical protein
MQQDELLFAFSGIAPKIGFQKADEEPWFAHVGGNDYSQFQQHGIFEGLPAAFRIYDRASLSPDFDDQFRLQDAYNSTVEGEAVRLPKILSPYKEQDGPSIGWLILERITGKPVLDMRTIISGSLTSKTNQDKIRKVAEAYRATLVVMAEVAKYLFVEVKIKKQASAFDYFVAQFNRWNEMVKKYEPGMHALNDNFRADIISGVLTSVGRYKPEMELFWNLFQSPGLRYGADGHIYNTEGRFEIKPRGFGIASWLWNIALYSWKKRKQRLFEDLDFCADIFCGKDRNLYYGCQVNFAERLYAGAEVDHFLNRSPFENPGKEGRITSREYARAGKNLKFLLSETVGYLPSL